jgi:ATP-binding cassette subfamily B protein
MRADVIHVMDGGRIVESGAHRDLLARGGRYAQSWRAQMQASDAADAESRHVSQPANGWRDVGIAR